MNDNNDATHPKHNGIEEQDEFEQNVGEFVTVSDIGVVGHRVWRGDSLLLRLATRLTAHFRIDTVNTPASARWRDGWMDGKFMGWNKAKLGAKL